MTNYEIELVDLREQPAAVVRGSVTQDTIPAFLGEAFGAVMAAVAGQGNAVAGPPFARWRPTDTGFDAEAGFPCKVPLTPSGRVEPTVLPGTWATRVLHVGDYAGVAGAYQAAERWIVENGYVATGSPWESYLDEPDVAEPRTLVFQPCTEAKQRRSG
jgi:effector-binding domain-containing protein